MKLEEEHKIIMLNNFVLFISTIIFDLTIHEMMLIFVIQSFMVLYFSVKRMSALEDFSTAGVKINNRPMVKEDKNKLIFFFILHFGIFNAVYSVFVLSKGGFIFDINFIVTIFCAIVTSIMYFQKKNDIFIESDKVEKVNIGTLMFTPYLRLIPMHLTIILASFTYGGILLFLTLKCIVEILIDQIEAKKWKVVSEINQANEIRKFDTIDYFRRNLDKNDLNKVRQDIFQTIKVKNYDELLCDENCKKSIIYKLFSYNYEKKSNWLSKIIFPKEKFFNLFYKQVKENKKEKEIIDFILKGN